MIISSAESGIPETLLTTRGDVIRRGASQAERLAIGSTSEVLISDGTDITSGQIVNASVDDSAAIAVSKLVNTYLPETLLTTRGDILTRSAANPVRLAAGDQSQLLQMGADDPAWSDPGLGAGVVNIWGHTYESVGQGTWVWASTGTTPLFNMAFRNTTENDGDNVTYNLWLSKGTYTLRFLCQTDTTNAIVDFYIGGSEVASFDTYSGSAVENVVFSEADISVASSGLTTLKVDIDGRNPSAGNYKLYFTMINLWRTA